MATERGLTFQQAKTGAYVSGKLVGSTQLAPMGKICACCRAEDLSGGS
jgi:hypothetical protein